MRRRRWVPVAAAAFLIALSAEPAGAGRPLDTEDTGTVEPGKAEVELGGDFISGPEGRAWIARGVLAVGLFSKLEAQIQAAALALDPDGQPGRAGVGDTNLELKYRLIDEGLSIPAVLVALTLRLPTGDEGRGLGAPGVDVAPLLVASKTMGPVTVTWNGGYTFVTADRRRDVWNLNASAEYRVTNLWSLVGEVVSVLGAHRSPEAVLRIGTIYAISERLRLDGAVAFGVTRASPDVFVRLGVTIALF
jgi:Putative MetA-pathway of phenol degradation